MARLFESYLIVDWSAASKAAQGADSIWIGALSRNARNQLVFTASNPSTRAKAEAEINEKLAAFAKRGDRVLVGVDFPLGFPRGTSAALGLPNTTPPWSALIDFLVKNIKDKPDNTNNRFVIGARMNHMISASNFPFWGCPPKDEISTLSAKRPRPHGAGDVPEFRYAEAHAKGAQPVWKLYYNGSVGGQALVGLPVIRRLRTHADRADTARLWPFETGFQPLTEANLAGVSVVFAEIYPSLYDAAPVGDEIKDLAQVRVTAETLAKLDAEGKLGALFGMPRLPEAEAAPWVTDVEQEEGWILGVPPKAPNS